MEEKRYFLNVPYSKEKRYSYERGDREMFPFLVEIDKLYESFVAEWLKVHAAKRFFIKSQYPVYLGQNRSLRIDLLLWDRNVARCVLDTKYKIPEKAAIADIHEMVSHANAVKCRDAILIYPQPLATPLDIQNYDIRVRSITFSLEGDLQVVGQTFLKELLGLGVTDNMGTYSLSIMSASSISLKKTPNY